MKLRLSAILGVILLLGLVSIPAKALAQNTAGQNILTVLQRTENVGITPDNPLYILKVGLIERLKLALTRNEMKRTELMLKLADMRLKEAKLMAAKGDPSAMEKAIKNYDAIMNELERELEKAKMNNDTQEMEMIEQVLMQLEAQKEELMDTEDIAEIALHNNKTRQEVLQMLEQLRQGLKKREEKVEMRREMIIKMLEHRYNMNSEEINRTLEHIENGLLKKNIKFRAQHEITKANRTITLVENLIAKMEARNVSDERLNYAKGLLNTAKNLLSQAQESFNNGKYFTAWELAKESERVAHMAAARPGRRTIYRILEIRQKMEKLACGPEDAEKLVEAHVNKENACEVVTMIRGNYLVRCSTGHGIENFIVTGRDCEIMNTRKLGEIFGMEPMLLTPVGKMEIKEKEQERMAREIRERLEEIKKEKGNLTPEDVMRVVQEVRKELMRKNLGQGEETLKHTKNKIRAGLRHRIRSKINETKKWNETEAYNSTNTSMENMTAGNVSASPHFRKGNSEPM